MQYNLYNVLINGIDRLLKPTSIPVIIENNGSRLQRDCKLKLAMEVMKTCIYASDITER